MPPRLRGTTSIPRPPRDREAAPVQLSRELRAHEIAPRRTRTVPRQAAGPGDRGTNDLLNVTGHRIRELAITLDKLL
jgi:starvation-inducible DNA-binding protein